MDFEKLKKDLTQFLKTTNYELYDLEFKKSKTGTVLTVYIDREEGILIDDCVIATNLLNPYLDEYDPIEGEYMLEVSSAGAEKELRTEKSVKKAVGRFVRIETYEQKVEGILEDFNGFELAVKIRNKLIKINYEDVNLIRLAIKF
ncbi:MAG: ribosome maturation factor RimP [Tenericutes bacterium]|nr:ribosome maturation factor RimP [Mycoplasmatota bacterium]